MTFTKLALILGLALNLTACLDEIDEETDADTTTLPQPAPSGDEAADATDDIPDPDLSTVGTCARNEKQADGRCLPK